MHWFSKIKQSFLPPSADEEVVSETKDLADTVSVDKKFLQTSSSPAPSVPKPAQHSSTLSPFASRILEKAKIESLKDEGDREKITSPAQLFMTNKEAEHRVEHIVSIALEKSKNAANKFTNAANKSVLTSLQKKFGR